MATPAEHRQQVQFAEFTLDLRTGELSCDGKSLILPYQSLQILSLLLEQPGRLVAREDLVKRLWASDVFVDFEGSLNKAMKRLREILHDSADQPRFIETLPRRGYRFIAPVAVPQAAATESHGLIGKKVSHYRVLEVIGGGGMGLVYKAEDLKLGRRVALKFLPDELASDPVALQRFEREAQTASSLNHPNICTIHEVEEHDGQPFIVMELLDGETLRDRLASSGDKPLLPDELLNIATQICDGLQAAHRKGIIHRDIKPANIVLTTSGQVKILDFGLAKLVAASEKDLAATALAQVSANQGEDDGAKLQDSHLTRTGSAMGTAGYMSPEQVSGEKLDARTDLFSFGLVLYEMATGQRAFSGETAALVHNAILNNSPAPVRELNSTLPAQMVTVIDKALEKDRERRYQSAAEMHSDLHSIKSGRRRVSIARPKKWFAVSALIVALAAGIWSYWHSRHVIKLTDKDTVVLADFTNLTNDPLLDDVLTTPLSQELQESPYITLLNPGKVRAVLKSLKAAEDAKITPDLARDICLRTDSRLVVAGSIADEGNLYQIGLKAIACRSGKTLAATETQAGERDSIVRMLGVAGAQLRRELGESQDSLNKFNTPLDQDMSSSLEAVQAFTLGMRVRGVSGDAAAIPQFKRAVDLDPDFALAHLNLAGTFFNLGDETSSMKHATEAFKLRHRLSERSRFLTEALYYDMATGELEKANDTYIQWLKVFPTDVYPHQNLSVSLRVLGQHQRAAVEAREAVRLTPNIQTYHNLMLPFVYMNRLEEAKTVYEEAKTLGIDDFSLRSWRYMVAFLLRDDPGMQEQLSWAVAKPEAKEWALQQQGDTATFYGHFRSASKYYAAMRDPFANSVVDLANRSLRDAETGNPVQARKAAEQALAKTPASEARPKIALGLARSGIIDKAEDLAQLIDQEFPADTLVQNYELPAIRAAIELNQNRPTRALQILQSALPYDLAVPESFPGLYPAYLRGLAYLDLGQGREAAVEFQKMLDHPGIVQDFVTGAVAHLQLGRAQAMLGDKPAARKSYQDFLTLWKDADPDIPILMQAKVEDAKLR